MIIQYHFVTMENQVNYIPTKIHLHIFRKSYN